MVVFQMTVNSNNPWCDKITIIQMNETDYCYFKLAVPIAFKM